MASDFDWSVFSLYLDKFWFGVLIFVTQFGSKLLVEFGILFLWIHL